MYLKILYCDEQCGKVCPVPRLEAWPGNEEARPVFGQLDQLRVLECPGSWTRLTEPDVR